MNKDNEIIKWHLENNIINIIDDIPYNHFNEKIQNKELIKQNINIENINKENYKKATVQKQVKINLETKTGEKIELKKYEKVDLLKENKTYNFTYIYEDNINKHK